MLKRLNHESMSSFKLEPSKEPTFERIYMKRPPIYTSLYGTNPDGYKYMVYGN